MAKKSTRSADTPITELLDGIIGDVEKLLGQQFELLRQEARQELDKAKNAALSMGAGAGLLATGGVLSTQMIVHWLHENTGLPLWACYGIVSGVLGAAGAELLRRARQEAAGLRFGLPPQTAATLREDAAWLKQQMAPTST